MAIKSNIALENGENITIRSATKEDAENLLEFFNGVCSESVFLLSDGSETSYTAEQEKEFINAHSENTQNFLVLAEANGEIIGNCTFEQVSFLKRVKHRCTLGISVKEKYQGMGIGKILMCFAQDAAKQKGFEQMELEVIANNQKAINLYDKLGFVKCGEITDGIKYPDGSYENIIIMVKKL